MTKRDTIMKWVTYAVVLLVTCLLQLLLADRLPVFGVRPLLLPLCAVLVGVLEGPYAGTGFGLCVGIVSLITVYGTPTLILLFLPCLGMLSGLIGEYVIQSRFLASLLSALIGLTCIELYHVLLRLLRDGVPLLRLLPIALPELLYSLLWLIPIYFLFRWASRRVERL